MSVLEVHDVSIRYMTGDFKDIGLKEYVMRRLTKNYQVVEFWADHHVTFSLEKGDMLGIIGTNGAGKSTLLKAVSGIMEPTGGYVRREGNIAALLELASGFDGDLTVRENTYLRGAMLGYTRKFMDEKYPEIIEFAELQDFQDRPFKQLSSGMMSRLAFSVASLVHPDILILDEVLSVGDGAFRRKSEAKMREIISSGVTTILVSHAVEQVREMCNKVLWIEKGRQIGFGDTELLCELYQGYLDGTVSLDEAKERLVEAGARAEAEERLQTSKVEEAPVVSSPVQTESVPSLDANQYTGEKYDILDSGERLRMLLLFFAAIPCITVWLLLRLCVPFGFSPILAILALGLCAAILFAAWKFLSTYPRWIKPFLSPGLNPRFVTLSGAFLFGLAFDLSYAMRQQEGVLLHPAVRMICHIGNGLVFAFIAMFLIVALRDLKGIGRGSRREFFFLFLVVNAITAIHIFTSNTVYVWDAAGYWSTARELAENSFSFQVLKDAFITTLTLDYNHLLAIPLAVVMRLFGESRLVFIFATSNLFVLPGVWAICALAKGRKGGGVTLFAFFPMLLYVSVVGFVDAAPCSLGLMAFLVYFSDRPAISRGAVTGALLVATFLLRRYFFFFAVSFGVAALIITCIGKNKDRWRAFLSLFISCSICALTFTYTFLLDKVLSNSYSDTYSAYSFGLHFDASLLCGYFGLAVLLFLLVTTLITMVCNWKEHGEEQFFCLIHIAVCFIAFVHIQSHGEQHLYLYLPALVTLLSLSPLLRARRPWGVLVSGLVLCSCFIPKTDLDYHDPDCPLALFPAVDFYGSTRSDTQQLLALSDYLNALAAEEPCTVAVMASSVGFNHETLINLRPSLNLPSPEVQADIQHNAHVDKRDAFEWSNTQADYVVVGDPVQVHLGEENQRVISLLAHDILDQTGPGTAYEPVSDVFAINNAAVRVYKRVRDWTYYDCLSLSERLIQYYPDYAEMYNLPDWITAPYEEIDRADYFAMLDRSNLITLIALRDEGSAALDDDFVEEMRKFGLQFDLKNHYQYSYLAVIDGSQVIYEALDPGLISYETAIENVDIAMTSAGWPCGDAAWILVDDINYSKNRRGLNFVFVDKQTGEVADSVAVDTYVDCNVVLREQRRD